jgi:hypothetical protein
MITIVVDGIVTTDTVEGTSVPGIKTGLVGNTEIGGIGKVKTATVLTGVGTGIIVLVGTELGTTHVGTMTAVVETIVTTDTVDGISTPGTITGLYGNDETGGNTVYGMVIVGIVMVGTETTTLLGTLLGTLYVLMITIVVDGIETNGTLVGTKVPGINTGDDGRTETAGICKVTVAVEGTGVGTGII